MVFTVRCFKCGQQDVRLIMGGRSIIHARCHSCGANLLAEVMEFEDRVTQPGSSHAPPDDPPTGSIEVEPDDDSSSSIEEETQAVQ